MPKKPPRNKPRAARNVKPRSIGELLRRGIDATRAPVVEMRGDPSGPSRAPSANGDRVHTREPQWRAWLETRLPAELRAHLGDVVTRGDAITIFTASAAWSARLKLAIAELAAAVRARDARIKRIEVKIAPPGARR